ncbi:hypothetical protein QN277_000885 [Acacia crassicarpa]|uniref:Uncharacterized protein n=1 Tax=Acacia crassicarpa TaxID=499986 RepID=A0AAE1N768_9FABA|nr:hypothetical protein QN277_000885 [Acacia crassicarpa]
MGFRVMSRNRQMGVAEFFVVIFLCLSFVSSSSSSLHKALSSDLMEESKSIEGKRLHAYVAKGGVSGRHAGGLSSGHTSPHNGGNGGESEPTQGGASVIPVYVAGAAGAATVNNRHNPGHHGTNNGSLNRIEFPTLFIFYTLLHLCLFV